MHLIVRQFKKSRMAPKVRIIAGSHRSRVFDIGDLPHTRPTKDRVKEALFNRLEPLCQYQNVCDCYAGVGSLSFECASRGAKNITAVEKSKDTFKQLIKNSKALGLAINCYHQDALEFLNTTDESFDLFLLDPPYESHLIKQTMEIIKSRNLLNPNGIIACLHDHPFEHDDYEMIKHKKYGKTTVSLWRELS